MRGIQLRDSKTRDRGACIRATQGVQTRLTRSFHYSQLAQRLVIALCENVVSRRKLKVGRASTNAELAQA
jgi:hypothetical protein